MRPPSVYRRALRPLRVVSAIALMLVLLLWATATHAVCSAFPVLSAVVAEVEDMHDLSEPADMARSGHRVDMLHRDMSSYKMEKALDTAGYGRKLDEIMDLKVKLGALSHLAINGGPDKAAPFLKGSGFQRSFQTARDLVGQFCNPAASARQTGLASRIVSLPSGTRLSSQNGLGAVIWSLGLLITAFGVILGLYLIAKHSRIQERAFVQRARRFPCEIPVSFGALGGVAMQTVVDVSLTGANVENDLEIDAGTEVQINFGSITQSGTVTWNNSRFSGVQFAQPLSDSDLMSVLALSEGHLEPQNAKRDALAGVAQISSLAGRGQSSTA